jgi:REP element-mobilizing transposase RayT
MRPLRFIPSGHLIEVSIRTIQGRLLLRPSRATNDAIVGILGRAQLRHAMVVHYVVVMSNHIHLLLQPRDAQQLAKFMCFVNSNIAREIGRLVGWRDRFWSGRYHAIVVSEESEAQLGRLRYLLSQGVKERLVAQPFDWPGVSTARVLLEGGQLAGTWLDRAGLYRARERRTADEPAIEADTFRSVQALQIEPLPALSHFSVEQRRRFVGELIAELVASHAALRAVEGGKLMGARAVLRVHPHTVPEVTHSPAPLFHAVRLEIRRRLREAYAQFVAAFREAAERVKDGVERVLFPKGSFPPAPPFIAIASSTPSWCQPMT